MLRIITPFQLLALFCVTLVFFNGDKVLNATWVLPTKDENKRLTISGSIVSIEVKNKWASTIIFRLQHSSGSVRLNWTKPPKLHIGDVWQLQVKLKRIHGTHNPGGFNYEALARLQGLCAQGRVINGASNKLLANQWYKYPVTTFRLTLRDRINAVLPNIPHAPWLLALTIGDRHRVASEDWAVLKATGTNHLMAIAGLHIGMISSLAYAVSVRLYKFFPQLICRLPAQIAGSYIALVTALFYSAISGFQIPSQRAMAMLSAFIYARVTRRSVSIIHVWLAALLFVLAYNPFAIYTASFWLSFVTLALIIYGMSGRIQPQGAWWHYFRVQWVIGFGLIPLSLYFYQETTLVGFIVNILAIPWLGLFILPCCLLAVLSCFISAALTKCLLFIAAKSLAGLWFVLQCFSTLQFATWVHPIIVIPSLLITLVAFVWLLLPLGSPGRWLGLVWLLPIFANTSITPRKNEFWLTVLDVGQGLATVVQTQHHLLVYDAGPRFSAKSDAGENIVNPYLTRLRTKRIDKLIISHGDNDHIGGAGAIINRFPIDAILTSVPAQFSNASYCLSGLHWQWDGVRFEFLYPNAMNLGRGNDSSCVLRIDNGEHSVLLAGDIEKFAEYQLLATVSDKLASEVIVAPHHGSKTSAEPLFLAAVQPKYVVYATGYLNRYRFPHEKVVERYKALGVKSFNTAKVGAVVFKVGQKVGVRLTEPRL